MRFGHELKGVRLADFLRAVEQQACSPRQLCALAGGPPHVAIASDPEACVRQLDRLRRWLEPQAAEKLPLRARQMGCCGTLYFSTSNLRTPEPRLYPFTECTVFTRQSAHPFTECTVSTRQSAHALMKVPCAHDLKGGALVCHRVTQHTFISFSFLFSFHLNASPFLLCCPSFYTTLAR